MTAATTSPPSALPDLTRFARVPSALVELDRWTLWRSKAREEGDEPTKIPYAVGGYRAKSSDPSTWSPYREVLEALSKSH